MALLRKVYAMATSGSGLTFADTSRYDPYKSFKYVVEISGANVFAKAGFQKISGLKMTTEVVEYREGGDYTTVSKSPGLTTFEPLTFERGMSEDVDMWDWASKIFTLNAENGAFTQARANMRIKLQDRLGNAVKTWEVPNAWVSEYETGEFDAMGNNVMIEKIQVVHEGFKLVK